MAKEPQFPHIDSFYMQSKFLKYLKRKQFDFAYQNVFLFEKESDIIACKDGLLYEYEFKVGEADFRKDILKKRHNGLRNSPNYFYYVVSDVNIIRGEYLPYAGIIVRKFSSDGFSLFRVIKEPDILRLEPATDTELYNLLTKLYNGKQVS